MNGLGDLIRAVATLAPDPEGQEDAVIRAKIAELLGIPPGEAPAPDKRAPAPPSSTPPPTPAGAVEPEPPPPELAAAAAPRDESVEIDIAEVAAKGTSTRVDGPQLSGSLEPPLAPPELQPLFRPEWTRALVSTALARPDPVAPVDVASLVDRIARREPITALPRQRTPTLSRGVQVLLDVGPGLGPFARDARELIAAVKVVAGAGRTEVCLFRGAPLLVTPEHAPGVRAPYQPPRAGVAVLAITDLGIAPVVATSPDPVAVWLDLDRTLRAQGSDLVMLVPYAPDRWPSRAAKLTVVTWDRPTTVASVKHALQGRK